MSCLRVCAQTVNAQVEEVADHKALVPFVQ